MDQAWLQRVIQRLLDEDKGKAQRLANRLGVSASGTIPLWLLPQDPVIPNVERPIRAMPPDVVAAALEQMRDSATRARLQVIAATGIPPATLMRIVDVDFDPKAKTLWVPGRRKGHGTRGETMPLSRTAVAARCALNAAPFMFWVARLGVGALEAAKGLERLFCRHPGTVADIRGASELDESLFVHRGEEGDPHEPCCRRFHPDA
jgi:hypothetical protein